MPPQTKSDSAPSIISANLHVVGNLKTEGEVQIDGVVDGDVAGKTLTVGADATINGEIVADEVIVRGAVNGRIKARSVQLTKSAKVAGDILHETLAVEAGAHLEGHCSRSDKSAEAVDPAVGLVKEESAAESGEDVVAQQRLSRGIGART